LKKNDQVDKESSKRYRSGRNGFRIGNPAASGFLNTAQIGISDSEPHAKDMETKK
jgi:hypothetical protein